MIRESVSQRLRDPLLLGSATILAASKMFCHGTNLQIHDKVYLFLLFRKKKVFVVFWKNRLSVYLLVFLVLIQCVFIWLNFLQKKLYKNQSMLDY